VGGGEGEGAVLAPEAAGEDAGTVPAPGANGEDAGLVPSPAAGEAGVLGAGAFAADVFLEVSVLLLS